MTTERAKVLRSTHLDSTTDDHLRGLAFNLRCSKTELIEYFIKKGILELYSETDSVTMNKIRESGISSVTDSLDMLGNNFGEVHKREKDDN